MNKFLRNVGFYLLIILVAISIIDYFSTRNTNRQEVEYTQFLHQVDAGEVAKVVIIQNTIRGTLSDGTEFTTITPDAPNNDPDLYQKLTAKGIDIAAENPPEPPWWSQ
ncbi:ATP-dependent metallopeptidase FtsH/Yme1/Tma family protein, partial [Mitsuokella sp.]|uniref:ATP-dependent metallopeptidase FtsH/Yme1/Tma family protein n=1 Tax=Mitsuokella sp. TaxID=2049034 RepID=UPI002A82D423